MTSKYTHVWPQLSVVLNAAFPYSDAGTLVQRMPHAVIQAILRRFGPSHVNDMRVRALLAWADDMGLVLDDDARAAYKVFGQLHADMETSRSDLHWRDVCIFDSCEDPREKWLVGMYTLRDKPPRLDLGKKILTWNPLHGEKHVYVPDLPPCLQALVSALDMREGAYVFEGTTEALRKQLSRIYKKHTGRDVSVNMLRRAWNSTSNGARV